MSAMDNTSTTQPTNPSSSSNETIEEGSQTATATSSTSASSSYCPDCPICNPPDNKSANASAYGTIEPLSYDSQPPEPTFLESTPSSIDSNKRLVVNDLSFFNLFEFVLLEFVFLWRNRD
ncbi:hypothetical protein Trihar35433_7524 [Trichoderma harzianum]|nr:hypothetical protein Trihar35433_7524 [Trichoderma harzianum]